MGPSNDWLKLKRSLVGIKFSQFKQLSQTHVNNSKILGIKKPKNSNPNLKSKNELFQSRIFEEVRSTPPVMDVGDEYRRQNMLVPDWICWQFCYNDGSVSYKNSLIRPKHPKLPATYFVPNIRHQHFFLNNLRFISTFFGRAKRLLQRK